MTKKDLKEAAIPVGSMTIAFFLTMNVVLWVSTGISPLEVWGVK